MNKEELIGKLQMVYVGDKNALDELIGYYDGLKQVIEELQQEKQQLKDRDLIIAAELTKLQDENKILKENAENNDKVVDKVNWENMLLKKENKQLQNNWNKLKEWLEEQKDNRKYANDVERFTAYGATLDKIQEIEGGING